MANRVAGKVLFSSQTELADLKRSATDEGNTGVEEMGAVVVKTFIQFLVLFMNNEDYVTASLYKYYIFMNAEQFLTIRHIPMVRFSFSNCRQCGNPQLLKLVKKVHTAELI